MEKIDKHLIKTTIIITIPEKKFVKKHESRLIHAALKQFNIPSLNIHARYVYFENSASRSVFNPKQQMCFLTN